MGFGQATPSALLNRGPVPGDVQDLKGATSQASTELTGGRQYTLINGADDLVWFTLDSASPTATVSGATMIPLAPYGRFDWYVEDGTKFVAAIGATIDVDCRVFPSGPA